MIGRRLSGGFILLLLFSAPASAGDCASVDLNSSPTSPLRKIPVEDQDGSGLCYAYVGATLANFWHIQNGGNPAQGVSPIYLAHLFHKDTESKEVSGGNVFGAIQSLKTSGNCPNTRAESLLKRWSVQGLNHVQVLALIESAKNLANKSASNILSLSQKLFGSSAFDSRAEENRAGCFQTFQNANQFLKSLPSFNSNQLLHDLFTSCKPLESKVHIPAPIRLTTGTDGTFNTAMENTLSEGKPAALSLCANLFNIPNFKGITSGPKRDFIRGKDCESHAVVLTGMKRFNGECRVLIRNSWGSDWRAKGRECACVLMDGTYQETCKDYSKAKEVVGCWFPRDRITSNTFRIVTL